MWTVSLVKPLGMLVAYLLPSDSVRKRGGLLTRSGEHTPAWPVTDTTWPSSSRRPHWPDPA